MVVETDERLQAFAAEYRALCEKHGLVITDDCGAVESRVSVIADMKYPPTDEDWALWIMG